MSDPNAAYRAEQARLHAAQLETLDRMKAMSKDEINREHQMRGNEGRMSNWGLSPEEKAAMTARYQAIKAAQAAAAPPGGNGRRGRKGKTRKGGKSRKRKGGKSRGYY
jgi:hypothetical protein